MKRRAEKCERRSIYWWKRKGKKRKRKKGKRRVKRKRAKRENVKEKEYQVEKKKDAYKTRKKERKGRTGGRI